MTAPEFFEKLKKEKKLDENTDYQKWIEERIEEQMPVEGNLFEAYERDGLWRTFVKGGVACVTHKIMDDYMSLTTDNYQIPTRQKFVPKKDNEPKEVQIRFIKKKE